MGYPKRILPFLVARYGMNIKQLPGPDDLSELDPAQPGHA